MKVQIPWLALEGNPLLLPSIRKNLTWVIIGVFCASLIFLFERLRVLDLADAYWLKSCFTIRRALHLERTSQVSIVVVPVTSESILKAGSWPWKRSVWGMIVNRLQADNARVIAFDIDFSTRTPEDDDFAKSLQKNVVLPLWLEYEEDGKASFQLSPLRANFPSPPLASKTVQGFVNIQTGTLGVHRSLLLAQFGSRTVPSLVLRAFMLHQGTNASLPPEHGRELRFGNLSIPVDGDGAMWINYRSPKLETISVDTLLDPKYTPHGLFKNKVVLIGVTSPLGQDIKITPVGALSGVEIQAQVLQSLFDRQFITPMHPLTQFLLLLLIGIVSGVVFPVCPWKRYIPWVGISIALIFGIGISLFIINGVFVDIFAPCLLLSTLGVAVIFIRTGKTEVTLQNKLEELKIMNQVSWFQTGNMPLDSVLKAGADLIEAVTGAEMLGILVKDDKDQLVLQAARGFSCEPGQHILKMGEGVCGQVARTCESLLMTGMKLNSIPKQFERHLNLDSFFAVPLISGRKILGVLWVGKDGLPFDQKAQSSTSLVANQLAGSIEHCLLTERLSSLYLDAIRSLVRAVDFYNPENKGHSERVASYALMMASQSELPLQDVETIRSAALLHDVGMLGHFEVMYRRPQGITEEEWQQIINPLKIGLKILEPLATELPILPILYHVYERYDGKGFPDHLRGEAIPLGSRILAIANMFDDTCSDVGQYGQLSIEHAIDELKKKAGTLLDPNLVRRFINQIATVPSEEITRRIRNPV